ncbi:MAG: D-alanyl-D-alanine carboxypeptidase family protein [Bacillota bacterium]
MKTLHHDRLNKAVPYQRQTKHRHNFRGKHHRCISRLLSLFMVFILLSGFIFIPFPRRVEAQELSFPDLQSQAAVLMEFSRGEIIYAHGEDEPMPPASLTKVMTLLLAYEALQEGRVGWDEEVVISEQAWRTGGSQMYLEIGQVVTFGELVTGIATISANDACVAIAEHLSGSESNFVAEMNRKAVELGLTATLFQNTSGLPHEAHYSSALDMARLAHYYLSRFPEALALHSQKEYTFNEILQYNRNPLLGRFPGADGLKTGHTSAAGYCLIGTAEQKGMRFIVVVMNAASHTVRQRDSEIMLNYAFRNYTRQTVYAGGEEVGIIDINGGNRRQIGIQVEKTVEVVIPFHRQEDLVIDLNYPQNISAPLDKHEPLGSVEVYLDDVLLSSSSLVATDNVEKAGFSNILLRSLSDFVSGVWNALLGWIGGFFPKPNPA